MVRKFAGALVGVWTLLLGGTESAKAREEHPKQCVTLSDDALGQLPLEVKVGAEKIVFQQWKSRDLEAKELIGFQFHASGPVSWVADNGQERVTGDSANWLNPDGVLAKTAPLRGLTLCAEGA